MSIAALVAAFAESSIAAFPGANGKIAFTGGAGDVYTINPDGSDPQQVTQDSRREFSPTWSPDGARLAYFRYVGNRARLYVSNADGSGEREIGGGKGSGGAAAFAPDGRSLVYTTGRAIRTAALGGGEPRTILSAPTLGAVAYSPDGRRVAFARGKTIHHLDIWSMRPDGTGLRRLTRTRGKAWDGAPDYSPDGASIVFTRGASNYATIWLMSSDGSQERMLGGAFADGIVNEAAFSPSGDRLVAIRNRLISTGIGCRTIFTADLAGSGESITATCSGPLGNPQSPDWQPVPGRDG